MAGVANDDTLSWRSSRIPKNDRSFCCRLGNYFPATRFVKVEREEMVLICHLKRVQSIGS
ncbi:hypothetical protein RRSWK_06733 [Rhodopirellula sp. SWK7]|nr:hypothetical protein RRSWK_06733 [Rhodopirellula sp. SWK7]